MSMVLPANLKKIYLKDSDKARLADVRVRIVQQTDPEEPCDNQDLVFEKAEDESLIPADALMKWKFDCNHEHEPIWFFTTESRCMQMVSPAPGDWTKDKLEHFAVEEKKLYQDWWDGRVYGFIIEKWDEKQRKWQETSSLWGMYGERDLLINLQVVLEAAKDGDKTIVCLDSEEMKWLFDSAEKKVNEFEKA